MARNQRTRCPGCTELGRDSKGDNLSIFADNPDYGYCHSCQTRYRISGTPVKKKPENSMQLAAIQTFPITELIHKPISEEKYQLFSVQV